MLQWAGLRERPQQHKQLPCKTGWQIEFFTLPLQIGLPMDTEIAFGVSLLLAMSCGLSSAPQVRNWKEFKSDLQSFSVKYPSDWNRLQGLDGKSDPSVLDIINFANSERLKGTVIKENGAEIQVAKADSREHRIEELVRQDSQNRIPISKQDIAVEPKASDGCTAIRLVTWTYDVGESNEATFFVSAYYCSTRAGIFRIFLTNWNGDSHLEQYQATALRIALSIRVLHTPAR